MNNPMIPIMPPLQMIQQFNLNPFSMIQKLQSNPVQFLKQAGLNVPDNLSDPNAIIQHLMNSGQVSQQRYEQARQFAERFKK